ncbi:uncharacterized protein [Euwallacea similis]|uniref:uncharacterized protein n=1 Tax=Euwallacea similis TaxID=1736056 RepID=UPI00344F2BAE
MNTHRKKFRMNMAARNYQVLIKYQHRVEYEGRITTTNGERGIEVKITPGRDGHGSTHIPIQDIDDVVDVNLTTIKIELSIPIDAYYMIKFGCSDSKNNFRRSIRADSNNDSGVSSGEPSPLAQE